MSWLVDLEELDKKVGLGPNTLIVEALVAIAERLEMVSLDQEAEIYRHLALVEADVQKLWAIVEAPKYPSALGSPQKDRFGPPIAPEERRRHLEIEG